MTVFVFTSDIQEYRVTPKDFIFCLSQNPAYVRVAESLVFCVHVVFCGTLFVPLEFLFLAIVLSVLRFMDSDYPLVSYKFC
jgi:hypothetical protein